MGQATAAGATIGTAITPGLGTAVGAGIGGFVDILTSIFSNRSASNANRHAAELEHRATMAALEAAREENQYRRRFEEENRTYERGRYGEERDYSRGQYANYLGRLSPFSNAGAGAVTDLAAYTRAAMPGSIPTMGGGRMVKVQAPDGSVRDVPASHAAHYVSRGAKVVG